MFQLKDILIFIGRNSAVLSKNKRLDIVITMIEAQKFVNPSQRY